MSPVLNSHVNSDMAHLYPGMAWHKKHLKAKLMFVMTLTMQLIFLKNCAAFEIGAYVKCHTCRPTCRLLHTLKKKTCIVREQPQPA